MSTSPLSLLPDGPAVGITSAGLAGSIELGPVGALAGGFGLIAGGCCGMAAACAGAEGAAAGPRNDFVCRALNSCSTNGLASKSQFKVNCLPILVSRHTILQKVDKLSRDELKSQQEPLDLASLSLDSQSSTPPRSFLHHASTKLPHSLPMHWGRRHI